MSSFSHNNNGYNVARGNTVNSSPYNHYLAYCYPNIQLTSPFKITGEINFQGSDGLQGIGAFDSISQDNTQWHGYSLLNMDSTKGLLVETFNRTNGRLSSNTWYSFELTVDGTTVTGVIKQGDTIVFSSSSTAPSVLNNPYPCIVFMGKPNTIWFKNLSIEPL